LKAKQDLGLSKATVKLKDLQVNVAEGEVDLAVLQKERSQIQVQELEEMINAGLNEFEEQMINMYYQVAQIQNVISGLDFGLGLAGAARDLSAAFASLYTLPQVVAHGIYLAVYGVMGGIKLGQQIKLSNTNAQLSDYGIRSSQARREQEWNFQETLANQDIKIGSQQV